uniref:Peptidase M16 domain protein n=1 Tax=Cyanothece sp. (strain PCC 7425 / ATCC 29141) TaxID=395961 RepID=B8HQG0_CYAP4
MPSSPPLSTPSLSKDVQKHCLANGLTVLTKQVRTAPVVSVQIWYRVGSRNEPQGLNGISHQLEHLLFKGTKDRPVQFGRLFSALGSSFNAFTSYDMTAYFSTVSQNKLGAVLALEADRMLHTLITPEQLASEKRVVISELQGYENSPDYRLTRAVMGAAFPTSPYGLPVGGSKTDVESFTLDAVQDYYHRYYSPANAVLVITGDFETDQALDLVEQTFGALPAGPFVEAARMATPAPDPQPTRTLLLEEAGGTPLLEMVYPLPAILHPDVPAIEVMDAVLSAGRNSRLYQALVETGLASHIQTYAPILIEHGWYDIAAIPVGTPEGQFQDLARIEATILETIAQIQQEPISSAELQRARTQLRASFVLRNRDIDNQASQLAYDQIITGDYRYSDTYLASLEAVTVEDVQRVAQRYLQSDCRTIGRFQPLQPEFDPSLSGAPSLQTSENFSPGEPIDPAEVARYLPPYPAQISSSTQPLPERFTLPNGLRVLLLPDHSTPTVTLSGYLGAGSQFDSLSQAGLADLVAENLSSGTQTRDALTLAGLLEARGASLDLNAYREGVDIEGYTLAEDLPIVLDVLADVLQRSMFPVKELELTRQQTLIELQLELDDPARLGRRVFQQTLYPSDHPFHSFPTVESLSSLDRNDLISFYQRYYRPESTILTLVGDFDPLAARSLVEQYFADWQRGTSIAAVEGNVAFPAQLVYQNPTIAGKSQVITYLGHPGIHRQDPRFYAAILLNQVLGGDTLSSRLGNEIRDRQGLTYGIYSYFATGKLAGPFLIQMQTAPEDTPAAISATLALLEQFCQEGITEAELKTAKRSLIDSYSVELANLDNLSRTLLHQEVYGLPLAEIRTFPDRLAAVSLAEVQSTIRELIHPDRLVIVTAGPTVPPFTPPRR